MAMLEAFEEVSKTQFKHLGSQPKLGKKGPIGGVDLSVPGVSEATILATSSLA